MTTSLPHLAHPKYRPDIDGLRAVAVLSVVAFHAFPSRVRGGFIGVDVFFVISGFLISTIIFENLDKGTFRFSEFYARRVKRIFPALLIVVVASYAMGWFSLLADEYAALGKHIAAGAGFVSNFVLWRESGYFDNAAETKPLLHLWSLGIEEQFYIIWPFLLWFFWKIRWNSLLPTLVIGAISFGLNLRGIEKDAAATFYLPQSRFWELLCGSSLAWFTLYGKLGAKITRQDKAAVNGQGLANVLSLLGFLLLAYGFWRINGALGFPGKWALVPVLGTLLVIVAGPKAWMNRNILSNKVVVWFGLISFPLYLWHWPLLSFARIVGGEVPSRFVRIGAVLLSVFLAWLTFQFIESPIRSGKHAKARIFFLVAPMVLVGLIGYSTYSLNGLTFRTIVKSYEAVLATIENNPKRDECHLSRIVESVGKGPCEYFFPNPSVAVVGNSHAPEIAYALAEDLRPYNQGVAHYSISGCPHNYLVDPSLKNFLGTSVCYDWHTGVVENITSSKQIKYVILSYRNDFCLDNGPFTKSLVDMAKALIAANKKVILVLQAPLPKKHIKDYLRTNYRANAGVHEDVVGSTRSDWKSTYRNSAQLLEQLPSSVVLIDPADYFCSGDNCYVIKGNKALFFDDNHMSLDGGRLLAKQIMNKLELELGT
ncbi:MAG TPA: acyltransferase family protein [Polyangium sp.]|nr:acyltransferase family protein [Polyangium sp.]